MIEFSLDSRSGVSPYLQVVHQVRRALRLGLLVEGDQLPTVKDVVASLAINPNTVLKAYRELERDGLVAAPSSPGPSQTPRWPRTSHCAGTWLGGSVRPDRPDWTRRASRPSS